MAKSKLCIIVPYFGRWPFWIDIYIASCATNIQIDWYLLTDCGPLEYYPQNVNIEQLSFDDYCQRVSNLLQIDFSPDSAFKLCDLKPALGFVHREIVEKYDYWCFSDIDLVYGDLLAYFTPRMQCYNCISTHETRISGHFCLLKSNEQYINAFRNIKNWQRLLENKQHLFVDESAFSRVFMRHKNWPLWLRDAVYFWDSYYCDTLFEEAYTTPLGRIDWVDGSRNFPKEWYWCDGKLSHDLGGSRIFPYFHFYYWKNEIWSKRKTETAELERLNLSKPPREGFKITEDGFFSL